MSLIVALEGLGLLACVAALAVAVSRQDRRSQGSRQVLLLLLAALGVVRLQELLEWVGMTEFSVAGETFAVVIPVLWAFLLFDLSGQRLLWSAERRERQLSLVFAQVPVALAAASPEGQILAASSQWGALLGAPLRESVRAQLDELREQALSSGEAVSCGPIKDGDRWLVIATAPWSVGGHVDGVVVLAEDITNEITEEEQFEALHHNNRLELVHLLSASVAHDLRNMLMVISLNAEMLTQPTLPIAERGDVVRTLQEAIDTGSSLLSSLTAMSRVDTGPARPVQLVPFLESNRRLMSRSLPRTFSLQMNIEAPRDLTVVAPPLQLQQILLNLLLNARDAMPSGGEIVVSLSEQPDSPQPRVCLSVTDQGCGIAPELQERIFEALFTTKPVGRGTGLGLSIVRSIAEDLGGTVSVTSAPGQGSTFFISLPLVPA